jgi:hypothetical protein
VWLRNAPETQKRRCRILTRVSGLDTGLGTHRRAKLWLPLQSPRAAAHRCNQLWNLQRCAVSVRRR